MIYIYIIGLYFFCLAVKAYQQLDSHLDAFKKNSTQIWHSYTFDSGISNREELYILKVTADISTQLPSNIFKWESFQAHGETIIVGLGKDFLLATSFNNIKNTSKFKKEIQGFTKSFSIFKQWEASKQMFQNFIVVATSTYENQDILKWYTISDGELIFLWDWPFHFNITYLDVVKINHNLKLLIISQTDHNGGNSAVNLYNFNVFPKLDVWLFERISTNKIPSSLTIFSDHFNTYLALSYQKPGIVDIWIHSKKLCFQNEDQKHFNLHQRLYSNDIRSITSFRLNFLWHIAVASKNSTIYQIKENFLFRPLSYFNFGNRNEWMPVAIDTYREDIALLLRSHDKISALIWNGNENFDFIENFTGLVCKNDSECTRKMEKTSLKDATTFSFNNNQNILIPTEDQISFLIKIQIKLRPLPDKISVALHELIKSKNDIKNLYAIQNKEVKTLTAINDKLTIKTTESNYSNSFSEYKGTTEKTKDTNLNTASFIRNWSDTLVALDIIKSRLNILKETLNNFTKTELNIGFLSSQNNSEESKILPKNLPDEIVFEGTVIIRNLNLSFLNGHDANDLLKNSYRKDKKQKIKGYKKFKNIGTRHLNFEKINDIPACDIIFSDDLWESKNQSIVNGNILWENKLNILNDFSYGSKDESEQTYFLENYESLPNISKHIFDEVFFEKLKIIKESIVLQSINSRPMILPVHTAPKNIHDLEVVNQARIETINVFNNLTVHQINGKNFSDLLKDIKFKGNNEAKPNESVKIEGVLQVNSLEFEYLNSLPIKFKKDFIEPKRSKFVSPEESYDQSNDFNQKYFKNPNVLMDNKRIIVFEDLDIDGIMFTESLNNLKWSKINNTLRKSFPSTYVKGVKTFTKSVKLPKLEVNTINNEQLVKKMMTDYGEQTVEFSQKFEYFDFGDLFLNGTLVDSNLEELNLMPSSSKINFGGNLTIENGYIISGQNLEVTDFVNDFSLQDFNMEKEKSLLIDDSLNLKNIKASKVVVEGSLFAENLNGVNLKNLENLRVSVRQKQSIEKNIFLTNLTLDGNLIVTSLNKNNLASSIIIGKKANLVDQFLRGQIQDVQKIMVLGNITTSEGINNYNLSSLSKNGIYLGQNNIVTGNVTFEDVVSFKNINLTNTVNGISLKKLNEDIILKHSHVFFNGTKTFGTLKVLKGMKAKYLNNHLIQDVTTLMGDQRIKGPITINGNVVIKANVTATGKLNGIAISQLLKSYSTELDSYLFEDDLHLMRDSITINNLFVKGSIQNTSFDDFLKNAVDKNNSCDIIGKKIFTGEIKFMENVFVDEPIGGVNLKKLATDIVLVDKPKKINGSIILTDAIFNYLYVKNYFNSSLVNDFDLHDWFDESIPLDREEIINGKMKFEKPMVVGNIEANLINDHIPSAIITLNEKQFIPVLGLFQKLQVNSDVSVGGNVNGYNLPKEYSKSLLLLDDQTVNKKMIFHKNFIVKGDLNINEIKGKAIKNLVTLDTEQNIRNNLNFLGKVTVKGNINNLKYINNVNLKNWYERSVFLNRPQEIYGFWDVRGSIKAQTVNGNALLNNLNFTDVSKKVEKSKMAAIEKKYETEVDYRSKCHELQEMSKYLNKRPYLLHHFDIIHVLETQSVIESIVPLKVAGFDYLIISFLNECYSAMYKWNEKNSTFSYQRHINIGPITKWLISYRDNATYLITSFVYGNVLCEENRLPGNIWIFKENSDRYVHLLTGNAFIDVVQENETSEHFYTLEENGFIYQWTIKSDGNVKDVFLLNVGPGNYRFLEFRIFGRLAITNGREIKEIKLINGKIILNHFPLINNNAVALPVNGKALMGIVLKDKIVIYENIREEKVFAVIPTYRAESVLWLNYGFQKQSFLVIASQHKLIEIFEYKGVSGFVKRMSFQLFSMKLQAISLHLNGKRQLGKFVLVVQKNKIVFLKADMFGDFYEGNNLFC